MKLIDANLSERKIFEVKGYGILQEEDILHLNEVGIILHESIIFDQNFSPLKDKFVIIVEETKVVINKFLAGQIEIGFKNE